MMVAKKKRGDWRNVWKRSGLTEKSLLPVPLEIHTVFAPDCQEVVFFTCVLPYSRSEWGRGETVFFSDGLNILRLFDESTYTNKAYSKRGGSRRDKNVPWDKNAP